MLLPLQGALPCPQYTQGDALGYVLTGLSAHLLILKYLIIILLFYDVGAIFYIPHTAPLQGLRGVSDKGIAPRYPPE